MSYENYLDLKKKSGPVTQFLIKDNGTKIFPVCLNMRKFKHQGENHFTSLTVSADIVFNVESYYTVGCEIIQSSHHQSQKSPYYEKKATQLYLRHEPLYEYGNEEIYLPSVKMISIVQNEKDILEHFRQEVQAFEIEQNFPIYKSFLSAWKKNKRNILKIDSDSEDSINWRNFFFLCKKS